MLTDIHTHSAFSADGTTPLAEMLARAKALGVAYYGVSEHFDYDYLEDRILAEGKEVPVIDAAADPFGLLIADLSDACLGSYANEDTRALFYGIGKWVYLIDALDDYEKDVKKKNYNPFHAAFGDATRAAMLEKNGEEVDFLFRSVFAENAARLAKLHFYFNHDLTDNIILRGLPAATRRVLCGCKNTIKPNQIDWNRA